MPEGPSAGSGLNSLSLNAQRVIEKSKQQHHEMQRREGEQRQRLAQIYGVHSKQRSN